MGQVRSWETPQKFFLGNASPDPCGQSLPLLQKGFLMDLISSAVMKAPHYYHHQNTHK